MKKFILLSDLDDVVENLLPTWIKMLNFMNADNPNFIPKHPEEITSWDVQNFFPMLTIDEVFAPLNTDLIWKMITPKPGATRVVKKYNDMPDVDFRIVTASHYSSIPAKREFLRKFFPFINWNQVIVCSNKQMIKGNVLLDDSPRNLIGGDYKGILFRAPHNLSFDASIYPNIIRVDGWDDAEIVLDKMIDDWRKEQRENGKS